MPLSDRLHRLAVRGCLIAGVALLCAGIGPCEAQDLQQDAQPVSRDERTADRSHTPDTKPQPPDIDGVQEALDRIATTLDAEHRKTESSDEYRRAEGDLNAQSTMAFWTELIFYAAAAQVLFTIVGIVLVRQQIVLTREAVSDTKGSLVHERDKSRRELTSYTSITPGPIKLGGGLYVRINVSNKGQTPARNAKLWAESRIIPKDLPDCYVFPEIQSVRGIFTVSPGDTHVTQVKVNDTTKDTVYFNVTGADSKDRVYVFAKLKYTDYTGRKRWSKACWNYEFSGHNVDHDMGEWFPALAYYADQHNAIDDDDEPDEPEPHYREPTTRIARVWLAFGRWIAGRSA